MPLGARDDAVLSRQQARHLVHAAMLGVAVRRRDRRDPACGHVTG